MSGYFAVDRVAELREVRLERRGVLLVAEADVRAGRTASGGRARRAARPTSVETSPLANSMRSSGVLDPAVDLRRVVSSRGWCCRSRWRRPRATGSGIGAEVLGELEVLEVADAVGLVVAPEVLVGGALLDRADRLLPLVGALAVGVTATPRRYLKVPTLVTQPPGKRRNDGFSAAIFSARSLRSTRPAVDRADPGVVREQRDHVERAPSTARPRARRTDRHRWCARGGERDGVLLPGVRAVDGDRAGREHAGAGVVLDPDGQVLRRWSNGPRRWRRTSCRRATTTPLLKPVLRTPSPAAAATRDR